MLSSLSTLNNLYSFVLVVGEVRDFVFFFDELPLLDELVLLDEVEVDSLVDNLIDFCDFDDDLPDDAAEEEDALLELLEPLELFELLELHDFSLSDTSFSSV